MKIEPLSFTVNLIAGLITIYLVNLVIGGYFALAVSSLFVAAIVFRLDPLVLIAGISVSLLQISWDSQNFEQFQVVIYATIISVVVETILHLIPSLYKDITVSRSTISQTMLFALLGMTLATVGKYWACLSVGLDSSIAEIIGGTDICSGQFISGPANDFLNLVREPQVDVATADTIVQGFFRLFIVLPQFWGLVFASLREGVGKRFSLFGFVGKLIPQGCLGWLLWVILFVVPFGLLAIVFLIAATAVPAFVSPTIDATIANQNMVFEYLGERQILSDSIVFFVKTAETIITALAIALSVKIISR